MLISLWEFHADRTAKRKRPLWIWRRVGERNLSKAWAKGKTSDGIQCWLQCRKSYCSWCWFAWSSSATQNDRSITGFVSLSRDRSQFRCRRTGEHRFRLFGYGPKIIESYVTFNMSSKSFSHFSQDSKRGKVLTNKCCATCKTHGCGWSLSRGLWGTARGLLWGRVRARFFCGSRGKVCCGSWGEVCSRSTQGSRMDSLKSPYI